MIQQEKMLSDWLIASDIDGTLNNKLRKLPKRNFEAIHKFVYDFGGHFVLSSARSIESMRKHFKKLKLNSGYAVFLNGAGVYDYSKEKIIWLNPINEKIVSTIREASKKFPLARVQIITPTQTYIVRPNLSAMILARTSKLPITKFKSIDDVPIGDWCKAIFTGLPDTINRVEKFFEDKSEQSTNLMKSSVFSFDVVNEGTNKGVAVMKVAQILGIDKKNTAAIGDYFNDYQMLKSVALPACCGQAPKGMKKIAKLVTCHCNKGAVADLVYYIIKNYATKKPVQA